MLFKRLFTFGCSFTRYSWMTWADMLGMEAEQYHNTALQGAGNLQIFIKLMETDARFHFTTDDTVLIMWSSVSREDRIYPTPPESGYDNWISLGNIYNQHVYPDKWVRKFANMPWYTKRDLALIRGAIGYLRPLGVSLRMSSIMPLGRKEREHDTLEDDTKMLEDLHHDIWKYLSPSVTEVLNRDGSWSKKPRPIIARIPNLHTDSHPTPLEHLEWLRNTWPDFELGPRTIQAIYDSQETLEW